MNILGLHISGSNSSAALLKKGEIIYATTEERISRIKYDVDFPEMAINKCLSKAKIKIEQLDYIVVSWNPEINLRDRFRSGFYSRITHPGMRFSSVPNKILTKYKNKNENNFDFTLQTFRNLKKRKLK